MVDGVGTGSELRFDFRDKLQGIMKVLHSNLIFLDFAGGSILVHFETKKHVKFEKGEKRYLGTMAMSAVIMFLFLLA